jgi:hypothetical protein
MACLVIQNLCYGDDGAVLDRRKRAADDGAIETILNVMQRFDQAKEIYDACVASLRLTVDRLPDLRAKAVQQGAQPDWVKPVTKDSGGGLLSFRGGLGTFRRKAKSSN